MSCNSFIRFTAATRGALSSALFVLVFVGAGELRAAGRALPEGKTPNDVRLAPPKDLDGNFPFTPPESKEAWEKRAADVRMRMQVSQGLWPMPTRTPLRPVIHGRVDQEDYTIEKVYFESMPGFFVTGSLYRPKKAEGRVPAVLCPHGHWANGRFYDDGEAAVKQKMEVGAEKYLEGGRSPLQARCVQLARMGCVVFHYDMIGYADSTQLSFDLVHRYGETRPEANTPENWGLFSPQAESRLQSVMGLQTWNSIRAIDFVCSLDDVDPDRIAVTGASGGGTQTFMVCAIDPRPAVAMPCVMVSTAMQGGCTCENSCLLRVGTGNIEIAGLFAPKPLGLTAADDWTREMSAKGYPELVALYQRLGAPENVMMAANIQYPHNYNYPSRLAMYSWFNRHLKLGHAEPIDERDYPRLTGEQMTVWDEAHPRPEGGLDFERKLAAWWNADAEEQLAAVRPRDGASLEKYRKLIAPGVDVVIGRRLPDGGLEFDKKDEIDRGEFIEFVGLIQNKPAGEELPALFLHPKDWQGNVVVWIDPAGKSALLSDDGAPRAEIRRLLDAGISVAGVDLLFQGEFLADGKPVERNRKVANPRLAAAFTYGYNSSLFAQRVHDVLTAVAFVRSHEDKPKQIAVVGPAGAGPWVAAARAQAGDAIALAAIDTGGFRFANVDDIYSVDFLPGGARYNDLPGMLAVASPAQTLIAGETKESASLVLDAFKAAGKNDAVAISPYGGDKFAATATQWLLGVWKK